MIECCDGSGKNLWRPKDGQKIGLMNSDASKILIITPNEDGGTITTSGDIPKTSNVDSGTNILFEEQNLFIRFGTSEQFEQPIKPENISSCPRVSLENLFS